MAAERTGRRAKLMEISPAYCDVIRRRYAVFVNGENCDWASATPPVTQDAIHTDSPARQDDDGTAEVPDMEIPAFAETE